MNTQTTSTRINRIHRKLCLYLAALAAAFLPLFSAQATDYYWATTNGASAGGATNANWSNPSVGWVGGGAPSSSTDNAFVNGTNTGSSYFITNDVTATIGNLTYDLVAGTADNTSSPGTITTVINPGTTLSVLGSGGFLITRDGIGAKVGSTHKFIGNTLTVSNSAAQVVLNSGQRFAQSTAAIIDFSGLTNFNATVNVFGVANSILTGINGGGNPAGDQVVKATLARTNVIKAMHTEADYTVANFTNAVDLFRQDSTGLSTSSDPQNSFFALGISNGIFAQSVGLGRGTAICGSGTISFSTLSAPSAGSAVGYSMIFNNRNYTSSAYFRNNDGTSRMSLLDLTVNGGGTNTAIKGNAAGSFITLVGGTVDMLVDQVWLAKNYTNTFSTKNTEAGFGFDKGTVNANTVIVGDMQYTNQSFCQGYLYVGSNAVMNVNNNLVLGYTPTNDTSGSFVAFSSQAFGQVEVDGNGHLYANQINVGQFSTNDQVIVNPGATLVVTNTIATATNAVNFLTLKEGAQLTLFVNPAITNAFTTNLVNGTTPALINVASYSGAASYPATNVLIHYQTIVSHNLHIGTLPPGFNNMQVVDDGAGNINLIVSTNAPKNLVWQGAQDSNWNHSSLNWIDTGLNAPTNITKFTDNDNVTFTSTNGPGIPTSISVLEAVAPGAFTVTGTNAFVFGAGGGSISSVTLNKSGTNSLEIDCPTAVSVVVTNGLLIGSGSVSSVTVYTNASMNFAGTISSSLTSAGKATLASGGIVNGAVTVLTGGVLTNAGTMNGALSSLPSGTVLYNAGLMTAAGSPTINTNSTLINAGTIYAGTLTVAAGGTLIDSVLGSAGQTPGSINVTALQINGTFYPGGGSINTTKVTDYDYVSGNPQGNGVSPAGSTAYGHITLAAGSTTYMEVNLGLTSGQTNTMLYSLSQAFGPSQAFKSVNGGTIVITNIGTPAPFAAGQSFQLFGYYGTGGNIKGANGLISPNNTLNSYPIISPASPGPGLVWDLSQLIPQGVVQVLSASDPLLNFTVTNVSSIVLPLGVTNATSGGFKTNLNVITELSWPAANQGAWLQTLSTTLTNGLSATNWISASGYLTNSSYVTDIIVTNNLVADPTAPGSAVFYRLQYP